jgi:hypothetical protein
MKNVTKLLMLGLVAFGEQLSCPPKELVETKEAEESKELHARQDINYDGLSMIMVDITDLDLTVHDDQFGEEIALQFICIERGVVDLGVLYESEIDVSGVHMNFFYALINNELLEQLIERIIPYAHLITKIKLPRHRDQLITQLPSNFTKLNNLRMICMNSLKLKNMSSDFLKCFSQLNYVDLTDTQLPKYLQKKYVGPHAIEKLIERLELDNHLQKKTTQSQVTFLESLAFQNVLLSLGITPTKTAVKFRENTYGAPKCALKIPADRVSDFMDVQDFTALQRVGRMVRKNNLVKQALV